MYCNSCGNQIPDNTPYCPSCGAATQPNPAPNGYYQQPYQQPYQPQAKPSVGFVDAIKLFFSNYTNFSGRSRRSEYWYASLFNFLVSLVLSFIPIPYLSSIWSLAVLIPGISLCVRRLHDVGKSGWWYLFNFLPIAGQIVLLVKFCTDSTPANQWGPNPKY